MSHDLEIILLSIQYNVKLHLQMWKSYCTADLYSIYVNYYFIHVVNKSQVAELAKP